MYSISTDRIQTISWVEFTKDKETCTSKLQAAAKQGLFFLELPQTILESVPAGREFANSFYKDVGLKALKLPGFSGYNKREHDQIESFYASHEIFDQVLPTSVTQLATSMNDLAEQILKKTQIALEISEEAWEPGTSYGARQCHFSVNHYRSEKDAPEGLKAHKDFGFVTLLDTPQKGLEVYLDRKWVALDPSEGRVIVLFARALEILVNDTSKLQACLHKVVRQEKNSDRISVSLTLDGKEDGPVYCLSKDGGEMAVYRPDYKAYLEDCFATTYAPSETL